MLIGERAARVSCPYQNKLRGQGTRVKLARGRVSKGGASETREGTCGQGDTVTRGEAEIQRHLVRKKSLRVLG